MKQPAWDIYETVVLIDAYYKMLSGTMSKKEAVKTVSDALRKRAVARGLKIDQTFRNENGIRMRFEELSFIDSNSSKGLRNTSKMFRDTMKMYRKNKEEFMTTLQIANDQINENDDPKEEVGAIHNDQKSNGTKESEDYYLESLNSIIEWLSRKFTVKLSYNYLSDSNKARNDILYRVYYGAKDIMWVYLIYSKRSRYISLETEPEYLSGINCNDIDCDRIQTRQSHPCQKIFFTRFERMEETLTIICNSITDFLNSNAVNKKTQPSQSSDLEGKSISQTNGVDNQSIKLLLTDKFSYGCRYTSPIELVRFRTYYFAKYGNQLDCTDDDLMNSIRECGFEFERKVYVLSHQTYSRIHETVKLCIDDGAEVLFFEPFYERYSELFQQECVVSWEMLGKIISNLYPKYHHNANCIVFSEKKIPELSIIESEIVRVWGDCVLRTVDELAEKLPFVPYDKIKYVLSYSKRFVRDSAETYTDVNKFVADDVQIKRLLEQIEDICETKGRANIDELNIEELRAENYELSDLSFYEILSSFIAEEFDVNRKVITQKGNLHYAEDAIIEYCTGKDKCTQNELEQVMLEVTGEVKYPVVINAASSIMVRVDNETFLSDEQLSFNVRKIDLLLDQIVTDGYIGLKEINSFGLFPFCGQPWNLFVVESFCRRFSKKYSYQCITANNKNVGAIIKKDVDYDYHQVMVNAVARSNCKITEEEVYDYLIEAGYIMRRKYSSISELMSAAKDIRERGNR